MWRYLALRRLGVVFAETLLLVRFVLAAYYLRLHEWPCAKNEPRHVIQRPLKDQKNTGCITFKMDLALGLSMSS
jgi:hypothetical protein